MLESTFQAGTSYSNSSYATLFQGLITYDYACPLGQYSSKTNEIYLKRTCMAAKKVLKWF